MPTTCEGWTAEATRCQAAITVANASKSAAQLIIDAETQNLYIAYMNLALLGCGSPPMGMAAVEGVAPIMPIAELINPPPELLAVLPTTGRP